MGEHLADMEIEVEKRYCDFVDEHAGKALVWAIRKGVAARTPAIPILGIEFETDLHNRWPSSEVSPVGFHAIDIYVAGAGLSGRPSDVHRLSNEAIAIELADDDPLSITEEADLMKIFNGGNPIDDGYYFFHSLEGLMDELEWLEKAGAFVPASRVAVAPV